MDHYVKLYLKNGEHSEEQAPFFSVLEFSKADFLATPTFPFQTKEGLRREAREAHYSQTGGGEKSASTNMAAVWCEGHVENYQNSIILPLTPLNHNSLMIILLYR